MASSVRLSVRPSVRLSVRELFLSGPRSEKVHVFEH